MTEEKYYKPKVNTTKDLNLKYDGVLSKFIDTSSGAIKVKLESDVIVQRVSHDIYTSWESGIRELIMNEVKACRQAKKDYNADSHIVVKIDPMNKQLVIQGVDSMGMSGQRFGDVVAVLGRSSNFDRSETGMFGMGIASYTTLTDTMKLTNHHRETGDKFVVLGRNGTEWLPVEEDVSMPCGIKIEITLNDDIAREKNYYKMIDIIKDCTCQKEIPVKITLADDVDTDDDDDDDDDIESYEKGVYNVELCDRIGYLKAKQERGKDDYWHTKPDTTRGKYHEIKTDLYDIVVSYNTATSDGYGGVSSKDLLENKDLFITLLDVPIVSDPDTDGNYIMERVKRKFDEISEFTSILINLKDEEVFEPKPDRDSLKKGWFKDEMVETLHECYEEIKKEVSYDNVIDLFKADTNDQMMWNWLREGGGSNQNRLEIIEELFYKRKDGGIDHDSYPTVEPSDEWTKKYNKWIMDELMTQRFKYCNKKNYTCYFIDILHRERYDGGEMSTIGDKNNNYFLVKSWFANDLEALESITNSAITLKQFTNISVHRSLETIKSLVPSLYKRIEKDNDKWNKIVNKIDNDTNIHDIQSKAFDSIDDFFMPNLKLYLKAKKVKKVKVKRIKTVDEAKNDNALVWHYSEYNHYGAYENYYHEGNYSIYYAKERGRLLTTDQKKRTKIQLTNIVYGDKEKNKHDGFGGQNKLSIDNAVDVISKVPNNIRITKADSHKSGTPVNEWVETVLAKEINTNAGVMTLQEFLDKYRDTNFVNKNQNYWNNNLETRDRGDSKPLIYLTRFLDPTVASEDVLQHNTKDENGNRDIILVSSERDDIVAIAFAFIIDGYINNITWRFTTNDKQMLVNGTARYDEDKIQWKAYLKDNMSGFEGFKDKRRIKNWVNSYDRSAILLSMIHLRSLIDDDKKYKHYFNTLSYCQTAEEVRDELHEILVLEEIETDD